MPCDKCVLHEIPFVNNRLQVVDFYGLVLTKDSKRAILTLDSVSEATTGIRIAAAESWRHDAKVEQAVSNQGAA